MKKTLSLILALLMSASCAATIFADEAVTTSAIAEEVTDEVVEEVAEESEYDLAVKFLAYKNIMQGKGENDLAVNDPVKRYEMAIFAGRIATGWTKSTDWENGEDDRTEFTDLEGSGAKDSYGILSYVAEKNIIKGYPDGSFKPEATVTYRDALAIVVRTLGYAPEYPWGVIEKAVTLGLTEGITGVAYTDEINRGVAAQIMYNALFNATTAKGGNLAMDSFGVEYGWENILVTATDVATYEIGDKTTAQNKGIVSFKLVEDNGEIADEVYYVNADIDGDEVADLAFGKFYNALFEIDEDEEYVDMIGAIEYEEKVLKNAGNDAAAEIAAFMGAYTIVDKYNVKNLSKDTLYNDEIIVVGEASETVAIEWKKAASYAINWETGDILKYDSAKKEYTTEWHYNEMYDLYFKWDDKAIIDGGEEFEIAGIKIMSEDDLAALKDAIKASTVSKTATYDGYKLYTGAFDTAYAKLVAYDFDEDDMYDYAKYNTYKFGTYSGIKGDGDAKLCGDCDNLKSYLIDGKYYPIAGTCDHFKTGDKRTYTITEVTPGYTGYVLFNVDDAANTIEIIKEIPEFGKNADEDSYYNFGIVRGVDAANSTVVIGTEKIKFDYNNLLGSEYHSDNKKTIANTFFNSMFNQFVKYVLVDGKLVHLELQGQGGNNYIVVEDYYGIDSDGYIVVAGYTTNDLAYNTFRIGAYDGWKTGSGFFYNEDELEEMFVKGTVYKITSTDNTEDNGNVYYVSSLGAGQEVSGAAKKGVAVTFEDNYRTITFADKTTETVKMSTKDKYVIVSANQYMPIYSYTGIVEDDAKWFVNGDLLVKADNLFVFVNATFNGFNYDTVKTGFIAFPGKINYLDVQFDGYTKDYYVYGATTYTVEGFNLMTAEAEKTAVGLNIDIDANKIYATVDGKILNDDAALTWNGFWTAVTAAYADRDNDTADYLMKAYYVAPSADEKAIAKIISKDADMLGLKSAHDDVIGDYVAKQITLTSGDLTAVADYKNDLKDVDAIKAYVIFRTSDSKTFVYFDKADKVDTVKAPTASEFENKVVAESADGDKADITGKATVDAKFNAGKLEASITSLTFAWANGAIADTHAAIEADGFCFGEAGECTVEKWQTTVDGNRVYGTLVADTYKPHNDEEIKGVCDLVNSITIKLDKAVALKAAREATVIEVEFTDSTDRTWTVNVAAWINGNEVETWFCTGSELLPEITNSALTFEVKGDVK